MKHTLTPDQQRFRHLVCIRHDTTNANAARAFGTTTRTVERWLAGTLRMSTISTRLLDVYEAHPRVFAQFAKKPAPENT